jgi:hypothetical protein
MTGVTVPLWVAVGQWIALLGLATLVIIMYRQMSYYLYVAKTGAESVGLDVGAQAPAFEYASIRTGSAPLRYEPRGRWSILLFVDPACSGCERSLAALDSLRERNLPRELPVLVVVAASVDRIATHDSLRRREDLALADVDVAERLYLIQRVPFAYVVDPFGVVRARGVVESHDAWRRLISALDRRSIALNTAPAVRPEGDDEAQGGGRHAARAGQANQPVG